MKEKQPKYHQIVEESGQIVMPLMHSEVQKTTPDGIEMGVLDNGMPYLSQRGLVQMVGIPRTTFQELSNNWKNAKTKGVGLQINQLLLASGYDEDEIYIEIEADGTKIYAYTEPVVIAILEYYAFEAKKKSEIAQNSFRVLSKAGFRLFVYKYTGYKPRHEQLDKWRHFHDRVDLNFESVPFGYYSIFREIAGMLVTLIRADIMISDKIIPDLSVGQVWGRYWRDNNMDETHGVRSKYDHNYPDYYPQAVSNPQEAWAYPDASLAVFREWFRSVYIINKFPKYILNQLRKGRITDKTASGAIDVLHQPRIENKIELSKFDKNLKKAIDYTPN